MAFPIGELPNYNMHGAKVTMTIKEYVRKVIRQGEGTADNATGQGEGTAANATG